MGALEGLAAALRSCSTWWNILTGAYGNKFVLYLMFGQHFLKGVLTGGGSGGLMVIKGRAFIEMGLDATTKAAYTAAAQMPWSLKPGLGMINDLLPVYGYHKSVYIIFCAVLSSASMMLLGTLGIATPPQLACLFFIFITLQVAWTDLMCEGLYTVKMAATPAYSADLLSWVWSGIAAWGVLGVLLAGPGIERFGPFLTAWFGVPFAAAVVLPTFAGWHGERQERPPGKRACCSLSSASARERPYFIVAAILFVFVAINSATAIANIGSDVQFVLTIAISVLLSASALWKLPRQLALVMVYMIVSAALALDLTGATDYWYLNDPDTCVEYHGYRCPGFSNSFFYSVVGAVDCLCMLLGSVAFSTLMRHWTYVQALNVSQVLLMVVNLLDVIMFERWNRAMGIPDWIFMLGKSAVQNTVSQMNFLPSTLLISKLCPQGIETTVFAMLAAYHNFGMAVSGYFSSYMFTWIPGLSEVNGHCGVAVSPEGETIMCCTRDGCTCSDGCDDFSGLWKMSVLASCLPILTIIFNYMFIPNLPMSVNAEWDEATGTLRVKELGDLQLSEVECSEVPINDVAPGDPRLEEVRLLPDEEREEEAAGLLPQLHRHGL
mmetsp:Transcript_39767/g.112843  ORF Transcript_39767/g.112843 Transcript_39767/m.112843 type:complete len:606 (-) Transcript_39767:97-1914(-)|eukprot:CAMPEP_0117664208 /NCGR_PEP_ID=MMETSP0804-20121206/9082_1 /TAXON_ID=1074897 /ORGANISM="Tetraselmis astigmatica, Strain CCMP880" /LENGTH=605 /DNA_ID=CAMNT_0005471395 /DNA_START=136 /DNA_END=1953 /DNA_ORIENTATION=-